MDVTSKSQNFGHITPVKFFIYLLTIQKTVTSYPLNFLFVILTAQKKPPIEPLCYTVHHTHFLRAYEFGVSLREHFAYGNIKLAPVLGF